MLNRMWWCCVLGLSVATSPAVTVTVAPSTGVVGTAVTNSIDDAIAQVNGGADADNIIRLRSTEGVHTVPPQHTWTFAAGKNVTLVAESGQPIIKLQYTGAATGDMLQIFAGTNAAGQTETIMYTDLAFIPQMGITYLNNVADGISLQSGNHIFNNCVFSSNNGSDGIESQEGDVEYTSEGNVGDDWLELASYGNLTLSHCTLTQAADDTIVVASTTAPPAVSTVRIIDGTCIANNGGAGFQNARNNQEVIFDGQNGRIMIANNAKRPASNDTGPKFFNKVGCTVSMNMTDVVTHSNGGFANFAAVPSIAVSESRIAFNNSDSIANVANFSIWETADNTPAAVQTILFDNVTIHDSKGSGGNADGLFALQGPNQPSQVYTITDSIFSGTGDTFESVMNTANSLSLLALQNSAVVTAGPHAVADPGQLGTSMLGADPEYVSETYTIGRSQENPDFLRPAATAYQTAGTGGTVLRGGAPAGSSGVKDYMLY